MLGIVMESELVFRMTSTMLRLALIFSAVALALSFAVPVYATTYYGPSFTTPIAIPPGANINIVLTTGSCSTPGCYVALPQGSNAPCTTGTCTYPQQSCTNPSEFYYSVHEVTVTDPNGNEYMLGSATTSGLYWPASLGGSGGGTSVPPQADALNVTVGDSFNLVFGTGAGGQSFTSVLGNPPNDVSPAGPYYWWTVAGNTYGSNLRLDQNPSITPTMAHGAYQIDIEGVVVCNGVVGQSGTVELFFDAGTVVTTPEFGLGMGLVVAVGLVGFVLLKKKALKLPLPTVAN